MLETRNKPKLPRGWSYPVGAQDLSNALEGVVGSDAKPVSFADWAIRRTRRRPSSTAPHEDPPARRILEVHYTSWPAGGGLAALEPGAVDAWQIRVSPVPSERRAAIHRTLVDSALPMCRAWLDASRQQSRHEGRGYWRLSYDEGYDRLEVEQKPNAFEPPIRVTIELTPPCPDASDRR